MTFEPITDPVVWKQGRKERVHLTVKGYSKNRPHSGGQGRAGRRKAQGWRKGWGIGGGPTPPKVLAGKMKKREV